MAELFLFKPEIELPSIDSKIKYEVFLHKAATYHCNIYIFFFMIRKRNNFYTSDNKYLEDLLKSSLFSLLIYSLSEQWDNELGFN